LQQSSASDSKVLSEARERLLVALKRVNAQIPKDSGFDSVFAVDTHGRVVAYLGYEQASGTEDFELGGYPVVADALHGYVRDDTLILDRPYRIVTRPVEYDLSSMPAGAVVGARTIDDRFARELVDRTGAAVAFYAHGARAAAAAPADSQFDGARLDYLLLPIATAPPKHPADQDQAPADDRNRDWLADMWEYDAANDHHATADDEQKHHGDRHDRWRKVDQHCDTSVACDCGALLCTNLYKPSHTWARY